MTTIALSVHHVNFTTALEAAARRATATHPTSAARIAKGLALVQADAVQDRTLVRPRWFRVRSSTDPQTEYDVISNGTTTCTCVDAQRHQDDVTFLCKHAWAVLLVRAARRDSHDPRLRHAYHWRGEEGFCRYLHDGRAVFYPGGHKYSFVCQRDELVIGPFLHPRH